MPSVTFIEGEERKTVTLANGLHAVVAGFTAGLDAKGFGDCGGNCTCGTCHVRVKEGTFEPMKRDERELLDLLPRIYPDSRLACQLVVREDCVLEWVG